MSRARQARIIGRVDTSAFVRDGYVAVRGAFDEHGVPHGEITTLAGFGIDVLPFEDPDGVQLELTAPAAQS